MSLGSIRSDISYKWVCLRRLYTTNELLNLHVYMYAVLPPGCHGCFETRAHNDTVYSWKFSRGLIFAIFAD